MTQQHDGLKSAREILPDLLSPESTKPEALPASPLKDPLTTALDRFGEAMNQSKTAEVIQLPLWREPQRGTPNSFLRSALFAAIQGKDRKYLEEVLLASSKDITVKFTGKQLNQEDLTVWETLVHLARQHPLGTVCHFTAHGLLKSLRLHTGNHEHKRLHSTIIRLTACAIEITHQGKTYFGSLVESGVKDELTRHYVIQLNPQLIRLYGETQWTALHWDTRLRLRRKPLAQALHGYYSSHAYPHPLKLSTLRDYTGSRNTQPAGFKRHVKEALEELVKTGFLSQYQIQGDLVNVWRV